MPVRVETAVMTFYDALKCVAEGQKIRRQDWPDGECIFLFASILHLRKADGSLHKLIVGDGDILATDWTIAHDN